MEAHAFEGFQDGLTRGRDGERVRLGREVGKIEGQLAKLLKLVLDSDEPAATVMASMKELEARKAVLTSELAKASATVPDAIPLPSPGRDRGHRV